MIDIVDYGVGNLFSLISSLNFIGARAEIVSDPSELKKADKIILPGVGAFKDAALKLKNSGMWDAVTDAANSGVPLLGICLGMQLLFEKSYEFGEYEGLSLINGSVRPLSDIVPKEYKIPQMGWNSLRFTGEKSPLFKYINEGDYVYFVHSFYASECESSVIAGTHYGAFVTAAVSKNNVFGCQFHPEKSGETGLNILRAFCEEAFL
ncbi:MAG: imidazole glycerol phosphate synthase subunit HisH [Oscillospiraceae bacterium]|nr:imidazole glycerol phosphate synthase subunit HisH [Oscillospiraceae bacterium]